MGLIACSKSNSNHAQEVVCSNGELKSAGIIGGSEASVDSAIAKGTVFVVMKKEVEGQVKMYQCAGSLVDQNVVLTAAHCLPENGDTSLVRVAFSVDPICQTDARTQETFRKVEKILINEDYSKSHQTEDDVALIQFQGTAPEDKVPFKLPREAVELSSKSQVIVAGYGRTVDVNAEDSDNTKLKFANVTVVHNSSVERKNTKSTKNSTLYFDQRQGQGACQGDSGGPTLLVQGGDLLLIGIISAGDSLAEAPFKTDQDVTCKLGLRAASVYALNGWIKASYLKLGKTEEEAARLFR